VGARPDAGERHVHAPRQCRLPSGRAVPARPDADALAPRRPSRRRPGGIRGSFARLPRRDEERIALAGRPGGDCERHQGARGGHAPAHVGSDRAGGRGHASGGGVVGSELRLRSGASAADRDPGGVAGCRGDRPRPAGIQRTVLPLVRQRRCRGRRDRRGDEEHHRDCGRRGRRTGAWPQRARGADYARARRAHPPGLCRRRTPRDARRPQRPRRSGADLHRQSEPQPARRPGARPRSRAAGDPRRHEDGGGRRGDHRRGAPASSCRSRRRWPRS
jgi:hypothetical protein